MPNQSYSVTEAAHVLGVSVPTLKTVIADGKLDAFKTPGGHWRITAESLERFRGGSAKEVRQREASPVLRNRRERVEELALEAQELRAKREIAKLKAEQEAEIRRLEEAADSREHEARATEDAIRLERKRSEREREREQERREAGRKVAAFRSKWTRESVGLLSHPKFSWLAGELRKEVLRAVETGIRERLPEEEPCMMDVITQTIADVAAPWYAEHIWNEKLQETAQRALRSLPYGTTDAERARASAAIREALGGVPRNAEKFELKVAADEAVRPIRQAVEKRCLDERLTTWAVRELPWGCTDSDERRLRRECAEILEELPADISEAEAKEVLEEAIRQATQEIEERKARDSRRRQKAVLIQQGIAEVSSYLSALRRDGVISSKEYWDSDFKQDLTEAVKDTLEEELSGEESTKELRELVQEIVDGELEVA